METNYKRGRRKEYKVCKQLRDEGFDIVFRSAGSHSPIDIVAINKDKQYILFVQCKPNNYSKLSTKRLLIDNDALNGEFVVKFKVI